MRLFTAASLAGLLICAALQTAAAQDNGQSVIAVPPAPPIVAAPPSIPSQVLPAPSALPPPAPMPPPGLVQTPVPPADIDTNTDNGQPAAAPDQNTPPANNWVPGTTAKLGVLNKIDGSVTEISVAVGAQANVGDLQVSVLACVTRPPGEVPDAAIFLAAQNATDSSAAPLYRGWIVRSAPGAAMAGDASETFRVIACS
jgi:hypothetical protein